MSYNPCICVLQGDDRNRQHMAKIAHVLKLCSIPKTVFSSQPPRRLTVLQVSIMRIE